MNLLCDLRTWIGMWLVSLAMLVLPRGASERSGIARGLDEQRQYDRYEAYCLALNSCPVGFQRWREQHGWLRAVKRGYPRAGKPATMSLRDFRRLEALTVR